MRILVRVFCKKDEIVRPHYLMIEDEYTIKQLGIKLEREGFGKLLRIEIL